jgi:predicted enzyme related to lactoylglutathione lyase
MFSLDSLGYLHVVVTDLEEATNFYRTLFGAGASKPSRISKISDLHGQPVFGGAGIRRCEYSLSQGSF